MKVIGDIVKSATIVSKKLSRDRTEYYNVPISFDTEVTSQIIDGKKIANMYIWQFCIGFDCDVILGRTWEEFHQFMNYLKGMFRIRENLRLVIYVHNLSYDFQLIMKRFQWVEVLALKKRRPRLARTKEGFEFRCSYQLSGYSLANLPLNKHKVDKKVGDLDYTLKRHSKTPLTEKEIGYCVNDVWKLNCYIIECMERDGSIADILQTKTSYVRSFCRKHIFSTSRNSETKEYREKMKRLTLDTESYLMLKDAFQGGFTHANALYSRKTVDNVLKVDLNSSYPTQMVIQKYPMSAPIDVDVSNLDVEKFKFYLENYCCLFEITFYDLKCKVAFENYLSESKTRNRIEDENYLVNNGRIVDCTQLTTTMTEIDYEIMQWDYTWRDSVVTKMYIFEKDYLPTLFVECILELYETKTTLKGVKEKEIEYMLSKNNINSLFGMSVTDIARVIITLIDTWEEERPNIPEVLEKYNKEKKRFLYYPWGVWITAYARRAVWYGIVNCGDDYVYCDTDSLVIDNYEKHIDFLKRYNDIIVMQLQLACSYHNFSFSRVSPKTKKGVVKILGIWDIEEICLKFKTNGAKRYMYESYNPQCTTNELDLIKDYLSISDPSNKVSYKDWIKDKKIVSRCRELGLNDKFKCNWATDIHMTVAGVDKKKAVPWMLQEYGKDGIFDAFDHGLLIPPDHSGKLVLTYVDEEIEGTFIDYLGNEGSYHELSYVYSENSYYSFSIGEKYLDYLFHLEDID